MKYHKPYATSPKMKSRCGACGGYADCPMLANRLWQKACDGLTEAHPDFAGGRTRGYHRGIACIQCTEKHLGRPLQLYDLKVVPFNYDLFWITYITILQRGYPLNYTLPEELLSFSKPDSTISCTITECGSSVSRFRFKGAAARGYTDNLCMKHLVAADSPTGTLCVEHLQDHRQNAMAFWAYDRAMEYVPEVYNVTF